MGIVESISMIQGSDKIFRLQIKKSDGTLKDITGFATDNLTLTIPGEVSNIALTFADNGNASLLSIVDGPSGLFEVKVSEVDSALAKVAKDQDMKLVMKEGAGPDFLLTEMQIKGKLTVSKSLFS